MPKDLDTKKDEVADDFSADAREASRTGYDTENQLSAQLITVTLAFIALIATAVSTSNVLYVIADFQKFMIIGAMIIFCLSILAGLINYFRNVTYHRQTSVINEQVADEIEDAKSVAEVKSISNAADDVKPQSVKKQGGRSRVFLLSQIVMVFLGLALTIAFVASLLFYTTSQEDYTDELPLYDDIMQSEQMQDAQNN